MPAGKVFAKPAVLDFSRSGELLLAGTRRRPAPVARVTNGDTILLHAASGAAGVAMLQLARRVGARSSEQQDPPVSRASNLPAASPSGCGEELLTRIRNRCTTRHLCRIGRRRHRQGPSTPPYPRLRPRESSQSPRRPRHQTTDSSPSVAIARIMAFPRRHPAPNSSNSPNAANWWSLSRAPIRSARPSTLELVVAAGTAGSKIALFLGLPWIRD